MMPALKLPFIAATACVLAAIPVHAQSRTYPVEGGVTLRARAYTDRSVALKYASRYDMSIAKAPDDGRKWDFTLDDRPKDHITGSISGAFYQTTYNNKPTAILRATLHQYEVYEERVTFKDLELGPITPTKPGIYPGFSGSFKPRYLEVSGPQTVVTPSGISVTLPAQDATVLQRVFGGSFIGNAGALFLDIDVQPDAREVTLPDSPLYKRFPRPVSIKLETLRPNSMVWYMADNTFKTLAIGLPNLGTKTRLDSLTLIVRQRVELQTIPIAIEVPVERPSKTK